MSGVIEEMIGAFDRKWLNLDVPPSVKPLPQPGWREDRLSRRPSSGKRVKLAEYNDKHVPENQWLHPTRGFRTMSPKRVAAIGIVADIKAGHLNPGNLDEIKRRLRTA